MAVDEKLTTPTKSLLLKVFTTLFPAYFAALSLVPLIDPETSIIRRTFFVPDVAVTYHGRNLGS